MSTNKKFRIQNGVDVADGGISINDVTVIGADGKVVPAAIADAVAGLTSSDIADLQAQVSAILGTSPETLDTLQEIVAAFEGADSTLTQAVADNSAAHTANTTAISNEETARIAGDATVQAAVDATNARTAGISTSSGSTNIQMTAELDMDNNDIKNANQVYAAQGFIGHIESSNIKVQLGTVDFEGSTVNFSQANVGGLGSTINDQVDVHLNTSTANQNEFLKWNGTDYEFTDYIQGRIASNQIVVEGTLKTEQPGSTIDWQDGLVHFGGSQVIVDTPTAATYAANKGYVDAGDASLQGQIDIIVGSSPATLDTLQEIVTAFENADSTLTGAVAQNSSDITNETSRAQSAEQANAGAIQAEQLRAQTVEDDLQMQIHQEQANRTQQGADNADDIDALEFKTFGSTGNGDPEFPASQLGGGTPTLWGMVSDNTSAIGGLMSSKADKTTVASDIATAKSEAISSAASHANSGDASLQAQIDTIVGSSPATLDTLQEIVTAFENADSTLTGAVAANSTGLSTEVARATAAEAALQSAIADLDSDTTGDMTAETQARIAGDAANSAEVATEKSRAEGVEAGLANDINVETARAVAVEGSLQSQIDAEQSARIGGDQSLQNAIDAEQIARIAGDAANSAEVTAEESARIAADAVLQSNIDAEASARAGADNTLQSNIDTVSAAVSAITNGSPETLNQLTELVAAYEGADASLQTLIDNLGGDASALTGRVSTLESEMDATEAATSSNSSAITAEETARIAGDAANSAEVTAEAVARAAADDDLQDAIDAEAVARAAAVLAETSARQNAITAETNARILADNGLQSQIDALDNSTTGDKSNLQAQITSNDNDIAALQSRAGTIEADYATQASLNSEIARASSAEAVNASAISDEQDRATAAEQANAAAISQEILDRQSADAALQSQIDFIEENTDPAALDSLTEIVSAFQSADSSTLGVVNSNTTRIAALEGAQAGILAWDTDDVSEGSTNLYFTEARAKACVGADAGSCIDYNQTSGKFSLDLTETAGALVPDNSSNADKLDGQHGSHYRIDVYDVNGTVVN